jgi:hypothetical protein
MARAFFAITNIAPSAKRWLGLLELLMENSFGNRNDSGTFAASSNGDKKRSRLCALNRAASGDYDNTGVYIKSCQGSWFAGARFIQAGECGNLEAR